MILDDEGMLYQSQIVPFSVSLWACSRANIPLVLICSHIHTARLFLHSPRWSLGFSSHYSVHPHVRLVACKHNFCHVVLPYWKPLWFISKILISLQFKIGFLLFSHNFSFDSLNLLKWSLCCLQISQVQIFLCSPNHIVNLLQALSFVSWCLYDSCLVKSWEHDKCSA